jgi:hypothetical protein
MNKTLLHLTSVFSYNPDFPAGASFYKFKYSTLLFRNLNNIFASNGCISKPISVLKVSLTTVGFRIRLRLNFSIVHISASIYPPFK